MRVLLLGAAIAALALLAAFDGVASAFASAPPPVTSGGSLSWEVFEEFEEVEVEETEAEEEEREALEEEVEIEEEEQEAEGMAPADCLLRSAAARILTFPASDRLRLLVHYTADAPTEVTVAYGPAGGGAQLSLAQARPHLGRRGEFRITEALSERQMARVLAAPTFTVDFRVPEAPHSCQRFFSHRLTAQHAPSSPVSWLETKPLGGI